MGTTLYSHTGTNRPTDIGPGNGGVLHSISILEPGPNNAGSLIVRDGGRGGRIIFQFDYAARNFPLPRLTWESFKLNGQLNLTLGNARQKVSIEMSDESPVEMSNQEPVETLDKGTEGRDEEPIETSD